MKEIIPSIIAKSQKELNEVMSKVSKFSNIFHLDIMDGKFVKNKSLSFPFRIPKNKKYQAHLMVNDPEKWIKKNTRKMSTIIFHMESLNFLKEADKIINLIKLKKSKVGVAVNPETPIKNLLPYLNKINLILIMTVSPGKYGAKFLPDTLKKIKRLKKINPKIKIQADGSMNQETISKTSKSGADLFTVGSFLQNSKDIGKAIKGLKSKL